MKQVELTKEEIELLTAILDNAIQDGSYESSNDVLEKILEKIGG